MLLKNPWRKMRLQTQLVGLVFFASFSALAGVSAFFLNLYWNDRMSAVYSDESLNLARARSHVEDLLKLAGLIEIDRTRDSGELLLVAEDVCKKNIPFRFQISKAYQKSFELLGVSPSYWTDGLNLFKLCQTPASAGHIDLLPKGPPLMVPYLPVLIRQNSGGARLALISMESVQSAAYSTVFLTDSFGKTLWAADGEDYLKVAFADTGLSPSDLKFDLKDSEVRVGDRGVQGILSSVRVGSDWVMHSLSYKPSLLRPVYFAIRQILLFGAALLIFVFLLGKWVASLLVRPLRDLEVSAQRIGAGDFSQDLSIGQSPEIASVNEAFNGMMRRVVTLLGENRKKGQLEAELEVAKKVQEMLFPSPLIQLSSHQVHSHVKSAAQCGGDFWGFIELKAEDGRDPLSILMIGDATGHGVPSALVTAAVRGGLAVLSEWCKVNRELARDPRTVLSVFNRMVHETAKGVIEMSFFVAVFALREGSLFCANAGHPPPYLLFVEEGKAEIKAIIGPGVQLGQSPLTQYGELLTHPWKKGSRLVLYSDGLTDGFEGAPQDGGVFGRKEFRRSLQSHAGKKGKLLLEAILRDREKVAQGRADPDDITLVICEAQ